MSNPCCPVHLQILVDNRARPGLAIEHGFAALVELGGRRLLFDTGQGTALAPNAQALGADLSTLDALILSHGHYDHGGGLPLVLARAPTVPIYLHPDALGPRFAVRAGAAKPIGLPDAARQALTARDATRLRRVREPILLAPGLGLTGPVARTTDFEDVGGPFFVDPAGQQPDPIRDDLSLWARTPRGLVVVVGCSHAGIVNILQQALRQSGADHLHAVVGGLHLVEASAARLARTVDALRALDPEHVVPCHCTGDAAIAQLRRELGPRVVPGEAGMRLALGAAAPEASRC